MIARAYLVSGGDAADSDAASEFVQRWQPEIVADTFAMLIVDGRTLV
jgi:hypothetical protein